jgi:hypothetical protein
MFAVRHAASQLRVRALAGAAATHARALSSSAASAGRRGGERGGRASAALPWERARQVPAVERRLQEELQELVDVYKERMDFSPEPQLRGPPPSPPTHVVETWAPAALVSPLPAENALTFRTRFYIDSTGQQQFHSVKVQLSVKIGRLGLAADEEARLLAVARPYYRKRGHELALSCSRYLEVPRNKAHLRRVVAQLLADARANAAAHAATPDAELPLAARSHPWLPGDARAFRRRPPTYHKIEHKSPG